MSAESLASKVRAMSRNQGLWATCRWCKKQGITPEWVIRALHHQV